LEWAKVVCGEISGAVEIVFDPLCEASASQYYLVASATHEYHLLLLINLKHYL
jgi:hypothetical protein